MFDIGLGWMEMAVIALLALMVIGPKELPRVLRTMGHWMRKVRGLAREFQSGLDEMVREADLEDAKNALDKTKSLNVNKMIEDTVDPTGEVTEEARSIERTSREEPETAKSEAPEMAKSAKPQTSPDETAAGTEGSKSDEAGNGQAKVIHHPAQVAPPHSITPPQDPAPASEPEPAAPGGDDTQKRA